jgi:hypothetical protein
MNEQSPKMEFENSSIQRVCWIDELSGDFITISNNVGAIKVWNVAK